MILENLNSEWREVLKDEFQKDYFLKLQKFLQSEAVAKKTIFPKANDYFAALNLTSIDQVKVVILGQDPYHGPDQAHGLCFSVPAEVKLPPSLRNIYKELQNDLGHPIAKHGDLTKWAKQGVLLLNSVLTVEQSQAASHQGKGWEILTDRIIEVLNRQNRSLVFVLWGSYAQKKGQYIDRNRHLVLEAVHPSPLSAHRGFFGTKPFSKINQHLKTNGEQEIQWQID